MPPPRLLVLAALSLLGLVSAKSSPSRRSPDARSRPLWPSATDGGRLTFEPIAALTDEFDAPDLDKWNFAGDIEGNTGCPVWNGPEPLYLDTSGRLTPVSNGKLQVFLRTVSPAYFEKREYFCVQGGKADGWCNWDTEKKHGRCRGENKYEDWLCRRAPYCLSRRQRKYHSYAAGQVVSKTALQYGYVETRVLSSKDESNTVAAAWLSRDYWDPPFSRAHPVTGMWEAKSAVRQRHWQEIDIAELAMTKALVNGNQSREFVPNVHLFAGYDGRHTAKAGAVGPPIFDQHLAGTVHNEMHWDPGAFYVHDESWAAGWNTFGVWWNEDDIRFIVNGVERARYKNRYIHQSQFIKFTLLTNLDWFKQIPTNSDVFQVDYVRAWSVKVSPEVEKDATVIPGTQPIDDSMGVAAKPSFKWPKD